MQPHSVGFYHAVRDSKREVKELLTESLGRFSTLTEEGVSNTWVWVKLKRRF